METRTTLNQYHSTTSKLYYNKLNVHVYVQVFSIKSMYQYYYNSTSILRVPARPIHVLFMFYSCPIHIRQVFMLHDCLLQKMLVDPDVSLSMAWEKIWINVINHLSSHISSWSSAVHRWESVRRLLFSRCIYRSKILIGPEVNLNTG